jgi:transcription factor IIIB 90 kDa subunit
MLLLFRSSRFLIVDIDIFFFQRRKTNVRSQDADNTQASSAAESVRNLMKKNPKYSKRINYDALKDLFVDGGDEKDDQQLYTMDEKSDGEGMLIIEEDGGGVGLAAVQTFGKPRDVAEDGEVDLDAEADGSDKGDDIEVSWEDAYEQEV